MIEKVFELSVSDKKSRKVIMDENLNYIHMIFNKNEGLPEHYSNSTVYMTVIKGTFNGLNEQEIRDILVSLKIPVNTK